MKIPSLFQKRDQNFYFTFKGKQFYAGSTREAATRKLKPTSRISSTRPGGLAHRKGFRPWEIHRERGAGSGYPMYGTVEPWPFSTVFTCPPRFSRISVANGSPLKQISARKAKTLESSFTNIGASRPAVVV